MAAKNPEAKNPEAQLLAARVRCVLLAPLHKCEPLFVTRAALLVR